MNLPRLRRKYGNPKCGHTPGNWPVCTACLGRLHLATCTSKMDKNKDCCPARHDMLREQGHTHGLDDSSVEM